MPVSELNIKFANVLSIGLCNYTPVDSTAFDYLRQIKRKVKNFFIGTD